MQTHTHRNPFVTYRNMGGTHRVFTWFQCREFDFGCGRWTKVRLMDVSGRVSVTGLAGLASTRRPDSHDPAFARGFARHDDPALERFCPQPRIAVHPRRNPVPFEARRPLVRVVSALRRCFSVHVDRVFHRRPATRVRWRGRRWRRLCGGPCSLASLIYVVWGYAICRFGPGMPTHVLFYCA